MTAKFENVIKKAYSAFNDRNIEAALEAMQNDGYWIGLAGKIELLIKKGVFIASEAVDTPSVFCPFFKRKAWVYGINN